jgi:cytochrome P450
MCYVTYFVSRNPEVQKRIRDEVDPLFRDDPTRILQPDDLNKLVYLEAVIKEASRILPPGPVNHRVAEQDDEVGGYMLKVKLLSACATYGDQ